MIDELTSEFTLAAIICDYCIDVNNRKERYQKGKFVMECIDAFELTQQGYSVLAKATKYDKNSRYGSIKEFREEYVQALKEVMVMNGNNNTINWYPGHMEKAKRQMMERLKAVDMVIEVRDARIPDASTNPMLLSMVQNKPRVIILSKCDMADPVMTEAWIQKLNSESTLAIALDLMHDPKSGKKLVQACLQIMKPKRDKQIARGIRPRAIRAMAAGIPNVGKSTLINRIAGKNTVKAADRPGVTKSLTWIHADPQLDLLDTPGVLWPKFDDPRTGTVLAILGSINDEILDRRMIAMDAIHIIQDYYPGYLENLYESGEVNPNGMLKAIAEKRHILKEEGQLDTRQAAITFLIDLRHGKLGRFTLEKPYDETEEDKDL